VTLGGTASGSIVSGQQVVSSGGIASGTIVDAGGVQNVFSGGSAGFTTVGLGGEQEIFGGGSVSGTVVSGGGTEIVAAGGALVSGTIVNSGGTIDIPFLTFSGGTANVSLSDLLTVTEGANVYTQQLAGDYTGLSFQPLPDLGTGTEVVLSAIACFAEGTRILTGHGELPVESLQAGDTVITHLGYTRTISWIGHRRIDLRRHANPDRARPIRIAAEAFPEGRPHRDLVVSPDHAVFVDGKLIPAKLLVNGASIAVDTECRSVTYYHVELDAHDILLAEGLPAESYLDTGNRAMFENGGEPLRLHPDFAAAQWQRETYSCAPFVAAPGLVEPVWRMLAERADGLGWTLPASLATLDDPDLHLLAGTRRIDPLSVTGGRYVFAIPSGEAPLRLMSRAARPGDVTPWIDEPRVLGVLVRRLIVRRGQDTRSVAMDGPVPGRGWWETEWHGEMPCRWTSGEAILPSSGASVLEVELAATARYPAGDAASADDGMRASAAVGRR
jgi:autotransporter passenger strand-loop-strand repeat protein